MPEIGWPHLASDCCKLLLAAVLGGLVGWQREVTGHPAGFRTHTLVALGSALYMLISTEIGGDPGRVAAQVVSGIGFLGAGTIIVSGGHVRGLTTASGLWATAGLGMAAAYSGVTMFLAAITALFVLILLAWGKNIEARYNVAE